MTTTLSFISASDLGASDTLLVIGKAQDLTSDAVRAVLPDQGLGVWNDMVASLKPSDRGAATVTWLDSDPATRLIAAALPEDCSHHNAPAKPHAITDLVSKNIPAKGDLGVLLVLAEPAHQLAASCAISPLFPVYSRKSSATEEQRAVRIAAMTLDGPLPPVERVVHATEGIRLCGRLVDMPTNELHTDAFVAEARAVAAEVGAGTTVIQGEALAEAGFGGLWGVGMAANHPPALVVLSHEPEGATRTISWIGKGIVYDTGGLSIKSNMAGMKRDMAGAGAVLGAFLAAVKSGFSDNLHAILCLAENAVGPSSIRPDDILSMYSSKTVEVKNTDAEGRLVLADGVAYANQDLKSDVIVDLATLTGSQRTATGTRHAAIICNDSELEELTIQAGRSSGNLVHPLPYCPEFFRKEYRSKLADMQNVPKNRGNAPTCTGAQFVGEHLIDFTGQWLHVDLAAPSWSGERGTGFGVALLLELFCKDRD